MKIGVAASGKDLDSLVDMRFGRCRYFLIVDSETEEFEAVENTAAQAFGGAGVSAAQLVVNKGAGAVIAGNFGPKAFNVLTASGVKIFGGVKGITVASAVKQYKAGKLSQMSVPAYGAGTGFAGGRGGGGGWGRGRRE